VLPPSVRVKHCDFVTLAPQLRTGPAGWFLPVTTLIAGLLVGTGSALSFVALHSSWNNLGGFNPEARSTVPYWIFEGLIPIVVSVGWTALILHSRGRRGWIAAPAALAAAELALLAFSLIPVAIAGNGGTWATNVLPVLMLVLVAGPIAATVWPPRSAWKDVWWHLAAAIVLPGGIYAGFVPTASALGA
jgi:hypothetical protein